MRPYIPIRPTGGDVYYNGPDPTIYRTGDFYQPAGDEEVAWRREAVDPFIRGERASDKLDLQTYQEWVELDWKAPHGSYAAVERLMGKIIEEAGVELVHAERDLAKREREPGLSKAADFESEVGDALWCTVAVASNGGVDVTHAVRLYLRDWYLHPDSHGPISFGDLQAKVSSHLPAVVRNPHFLVEDYEPVDFVPNTKTYLRWFSLAAGNILDRQYGYNEKPDWAAIGQFIGKITDVRSPEALKLVDTFAQLLEAARDTGADDIEVAILEDYFKRIADEYLSPIIGIGIAFLEYIARKHGLSLGAVAVANMQKIGGRVIANTVDKTDSPRT